MAHTKLLEKILEVAKEKQQKEELDYCSEKFIFLAIKSVIDNPQLLKDTEVDDNELNALKVLVEKSSTIDIDEVNKQIQNKEFDDERASKSVIRWLTVQSRTAVDVWKKIEDDFFDKSGDEKNVVGMEIRESEVRKAEEKESEHEQAEGKGTESRIAEKKESSDIADTNSMEDLVSEVTALRNDLLDVIMGQDFAVNKFVDGYFRGELAAVLSDKENRRGPRSMFMFLGRPGVGKTLLSETASKLIKRPLMKVDLSNGNVDYSEDIQSNFSSSGARELRDSTLSNFVNKVPKGIILFDEIEKAPKAVLLMLLTILDGGVSGGDDFRDTIIIFTTNAGKNVYTTSEYGRLSAVPDQVIINTLKDDNFPPEIVSRLSTGTLILFDNLPAASLISMTQKELDKNYKNIKDKFDITVNADENIAATALYSIGGNADGRNSVACAKDFFSKQIQELFGLVAVDRGPSAINQIKEINMKVDFEAESDQIKKLYSDNENIEVLFLVDEKKREQIESEEYKCTVKCATTLQDYIEIIRKDDVTIAFIDYLLAMQSEDDVLNVEDIKSEGRVAFDATLKKSSSTTVYILETVDNQFNVEEKKTLINNGAQGVINIKENYSEYISNICDSVCKQNSMEELSLRHKVLSYNVKQMISNDGHSIDVILYDLALTDAFDSEDRAVIMTEDDNPDMTWDDIVVPDNVVAELQAAIDYMQNPKVYLAKYKKAPKGVLMYGPPGTGKTSIAQVVASMSGVTFIPIAGADLESRFAGATTENVRKIFAQARRNAPSILFIDEIDAIGTQRSDTRDSVGGAAKDQNSVVTALLNEMQGFKTHSGKPVLVMAATNEKDQLDEALLRRFDRKIEVGNPDKKQRIKLLEMFRRKNPDILKYDDEIINLIAIKSAGMSPAKLTIVIDKTIEKALREDGIVTNDALDEAFETELYGEEREHDDEAVLSTARHEVGHAFISYYYRGKHDYITIVSRGDFGGYSLGTDDEKKGKYTRDELLHEISETLGGRAAEMLFYKEAGITTGPSQDLQMATRYAKRMICEFGMSDTIGLISLAGLKDSSKNSIPDELYTRVSDEINRILSEQLEKATKILSANIDLVNKLVDALMDRRYLTGSDITEILGDYKKFNRVD